jgi:lipopolysaccharide biosynthesis glycosyltransferase
MTSETSPTGCVCYVVDEGYLLPTLVSARQARENLSPEVGDVIIVCVGQPSARTEAAARVAAQLDLRFMPALPADIGHLHVMFGRFFLSDILPARYRRVLYIDGDTQVRRTLDPLFTVDIPPGGFLACRDPGVLFAQRDRTLRRRMREHRASIGLAVAPENYCNSGVLAFERTEWREVASNCVELYRARGRAFIHPDQDALNLAASERCTFISNRWNFPGFLIGSDAEAETRPHIYHFMSNPRPWTVAARPWGEAWRSPYRELLAQHPELGFMKPAPSRAYRTRYWLQQFVKATTAYRAVGRMREAPPQLAV